LKTDQQNSLQIGTSGLWGKEMKRSTFGISRWKVKAHMSQMGERDISKMDEPILMQVGISGPRGK